MLVQSFASGSSGNALLIKRHGRAVLVDCGVAPRALHKLLAAHQLRLDEVDGVLVTHEHHDHVRGLEALVKAGRPVLCTEGTAHALGLGRSGYRPISPARSLEIGGFDVMPIATSHDANEPCGFSLFNGEERITLLTDLGCTTDLALPYVTESCLIVIEANHDVHMLRSGPYPTHLKRRVASSQGHLSNADCGGFLARALASERHSRAIWLAHLSAVNNQPALAVRSVTEPLSKLPAVHAVVALPRNAAGPTWTPEAPPVGTQLSLFG
jgi:phosphoribosyl 1,2-cyclic phosphodiesterase